MLTGFKSAFGLNLDFLKFSALPAPSQAAVVPDSLSHDSMKIEWSRVEGVQSYTVTVQPAAGRKLEKC